MPRIVTQRRIENLLRSAVLLAAMAAVLALVGWLLGGSSGVLWTLGLAVAFAVFAPTIGPERRMRASGARPLHPAEAPALQDAVRAMAARAGIEAPQLYLVPLPGPQAFATTSGGDGAIGLSPSLLTHLGPREALAVLAHELSHLRHRDLGVMRLAETVRRLTGTMSTLGLVLVFLTLPLALVTGLQIPWLAVLLLVVAPWAVGALSLALSRSRELDADVGAVALTGDPIALARALAKIEEAHRGPWWTRFVAVELPAWMRTHPSTEERVARLLQMAAVAGSGVAAPDRMPPTAPRSVQGRRVVRPVWIRRPRPRTARARHVAG